MTEDIPSEPADINPSGGADLNDLLAEFDSATAANKEMDSQGRINVTPDASGRLPWKHPPSPTSDGNAAQPESKPADAPPIAEAIDLEPTKQELHDFMYRVGSAYMRFRPNGSSEVAQRDYKSVVNRVQKAVKDAGLHVPEDYAETAILARQAIDAELRQAFDDRNKSAEHTKQFNRLISTLEKSLVSKALQDRAFAEGANVSADREAVAPLYAGCIHRQDTGRAARDYSSLSNKDLDNEWDKVAAGANGR